MNKMNLKEIVFISILLSFSLFWDKSVLCRRTNEILKINCKKTTGKESEKEQEKLTNEILKVSKRNSQDKPQENNK